MKFIPYGHQDINREDIEQITSVLISDWITQGPTIDAFEAKVANYCGSKYAIAVSSATAALHLACLALDLGPGDYLWTSTNSFVASANCAMYCGAHVDFVDIDLKTYNMCVEALEEKLIYAEKKNTLPKIIVPVHFAGQSCDMTRIKELSHRYNFKILEDASHAIGGSYKKEKIGNCKYSDITVFSFHPVKIITTGEGGMLLTNDKNFQDKLFRLRSHGITRHEAHMEGHSHGPWYYQQLELGFNYRLTDIQAALGLSQLKRIDEYIRLRRELAQKYSQNFAGLPLRTPFQNVNCDSAWHLYVVLLNLEALTTTRLKIFEEMRRANIGVNVHYIPIHTQPYYQKRNNYLVKQFKNAEHYYQRALTLPLYPTMTSVDQERIIKTMRTLLQ